MCAPVGVLDELEAAWLAECTSSTFEQLPKSSWETLPALSSPSDCPDCWRKLGFARAKALHGILKQSKESLTEDVVLKTREYAKSNSILKGRQIM